MADNVAITAGSGTTVATDDAAGVHYQRVKLVDGTADSTAAIGGDATNGLDVDVTRVPAPLSTTGGGTEAAALRVTVATDSTGVLSVDDNGGSITVDAPVGTPAFVRLSDGASAISTLPVSLASLPALAAGTANIGDVDVLTVPAPLSTTGGGTEATALRVTLANDSTGLVSVDDNSGSLTVDAPVGTPVYVRLSDGAAAITTLPVSLSSVPSHAVTNAGTFAVQIDGAASTINSTSSDGGTALTSTAQAIKASAGSLKGYYIYNPNSTAQFVQFYNTAQGSVTVGTTNPLFMLTVPPLAAANLWMPGGVNFATAMSWSATSTAGGNGAPSTALDAVCWYS